MGKLVNKKHFTTTLPFETIERLQKYHNETDIPTTIVINKAINEYLDKKFAELKK